LTVTASEKDFLRRYFRGRRFLIMIARLNFMGGAERQGMMLADFLRSEVGAEVSFLTSTDGERMGRRLRRLGIDYHVCPVLSATTRWKNLKMLKRLYVLMRRHINPDLIIPFVGRNSKIIAHVYNLIGARYTLWNQRDEGRRLHGSAAQRRALRWVEDIVSNSWEGKRFLCDKFGLSDPQVTVINNGVRIPDRSQIPPYWRDELDLSPDVLLVSMVANITRYKDHETLLRGWKSVQQWGRSNGRKVALVLAGKEFGPATELKALAFEEGLGGTVFFVGHTDRVPALMKESDLIVHSSYLEGCPNAILEAMAVGRPVVATDISGSRQALGTQHAARCLAPPRDPDELAEKIVNVLSDERLRREMGETNLRRVRQEFSVEKMGYSYLRLIHNSLRRRGLANTGNAEGPGSLVTSG
jgi:glycosyltransferase involved in cell wall biosynthesis